MNSHCDVAQDIAVHVNGAGRCKRAESWGSKHADLLVESEARMAFELAIHTKEGQLRLLGDVVVHLFGTRQESLVDGLVK